jgi:hypothetical protein
MEVPWAIIMLAAGPGLPVSSSNEAEDKRAQVQRQNACGYNYNYATSVIAKATQGLPRN